MYSNWLIVVLGCIGFFYGITLHYFNYLKALELMRRQQIIF